MHHHRGDYAAAVLPGGQVMVAGGAKFGDGQSSVEIYDPSSGQWTQVACMKDPRGLAQAIVLRSGKVLVAGGIDASRNPQATAELYDPATKTWSLTGSMRWPRYRCGEVMLPNGQVLVMGGFSRYGR
jgi:N-acetylneuraminic acid mutarotase